MVERVDQVLRNPASGFRLAPLDLGVAEAIRRIPRIEVPDLPDRVIAAMSLALDFPLVTRDGRIRAVVRKAVISETVKHGADDFRYRPPEDALREGGTPAVRRRMRIHRSSLMRSLSGRDATSGMMSSAREGCTLR